MCFIASGCSGFLSQSKNLKSSVTLIQIKLKQILNCAIATQPLLIKQIHG